MQAPGLENITCENLPFPRRLYSVIWKLFFRVNVRIFLRHKRPDFVIYPNFSPFPFIHSSHAKTITVIHDLTYLHYPYTVERKNMFFLKKAVKASAQYSNAIFFPSNFTRDDFKDNYHTTATLHVAYPGYSKSPGNDSIRQNILNIANHHFILFIGTIEPRKNLEELCKAYLQSKFYHNNVPLVLAGKMGWGDVVIPQDKNIISTGVINDTERNLLLDKCAAFTFPSIFEGFGMPLIEAMQHKKPVVASLNSSISEIANDQNAYCINTPFKSSDILPQLESLFSDLNSRSPALTRKIENSYESSSEFTWRNCASKYIDFIVSQRK